MQRFWEGLWPLKSSSPCSVPLQAASVTAALTDAELDAVVL